MAKKCGTADRQFSENCRVLIDQLIMATEDIYSMASFQMYALQESSINTNIRSLYKLLVGSMKSLARGLTFETMAKNVNTRIVRQVTGRYTGVYNCTHSDKIPKTKELYDAYREYFAHLICLADYIMSFDYNEVHYDVGLYEGFPGYTHDITPKEHDKICREFVKATSDALECLLNRLKKLHNALDDAVPTGSKLFDYVIDVKESLKLYTKFVTYRVLNMATENLRKFDWCLNNDPECTYKLDLQLALTKFHSNYVHNLYTPIK